MSVIAVHVVLLLIDLTDDSDALKLLFIELDLLCDELIDILEISANVLQLLLDRLADPFAGPLLALCKFKIVGSGIYPVHPWLFQVVCIADLIDDVLKIFSAFVQKVDVLWELDVLRCAGRIQHQCTGVLFL